MYNSNKQGDCASAVFCDCSHDLQGKATRQSLRLQPLPSCCRRCVHRIARNKQSDLKRCFFSFPRENFCSSEDSLMRLTRYGVVSIIFASHVTRHTSHVTRHTSHVTRHTSHVTRHTSHVTTTQDGSGDLDLGELNAVLASISGGALSAGGVGDDGVEHDERDGSCRTTATIQQTRSTRMYVPHLSDCLLQVMPALF